MQTRAARRRLVERLEHEARAAPGRYHLKLGLLAALGYAVLGVSLLLTLGVAVFLVLYLLVVRPPVEPNIAVPILLLGAVGIMVLRALWVRFGVPDGHLLQAGEAPALQAEVERIRREVGADPPHGILLNPELNAAAAYVPHGFGLWRQRHYLILGLPLLQLLETRELAAVIAHEFGHFHGGHGRFVGWIYRLRSSWYRLMQGMAGGGMAGGQLFWLFFRWYAPYFDAYSLVLARRHEYAADEVAALVAGADTAATALVRIELASDWLQRGFWPEIRNSAHAQAYPPTQVHAQLSAALATQPFTPVALPQWLLEQEADPDDTHPTLAKRLAALGVGTDLQVQARGPASAAGSLLGDALVQQLEQRFSHEWAQAKREEWASRHQQRERERARLAGLEASAVRAPAEAVEYASLVEDQRPNIDALPLYREALQHLPSHAAGHCRLGALLLKRGQEAEGLEHLRRAMELDADMIAPALQHLQDYLRTQPNGAPAFATVSALQARYAAQLTDPDPGEQAMEADELSAHGLDAAQVQAFARSLAGFGKIRSAWIVRKQAQGLSALPHYLVLVDWAGSMASESVGLVQLAKQVKLPGSSALLSTSGRNAQAQRVRQVAGEPSYRRQ